MHPVESEIFDNVKQDQFRHRRQIVQSHREVLRNRYPVGHLHDQQKRQIVEPQRQEISPKDRSIENGTRRIQPLRRKTEETDPPEQQIGIQTVIHHTLPNARRS